MRKHTIGSIICCSLLCLAGCGRGGADAPADQATAPRVEANPTAATADPHSADDPEHRLADSLAEVWANMQESGAIEKRIYDYNREAFGEQTEGSRQRAHFRQRFYELVDAETSGTMEWDNQRKTLARVLAAHYPEIADRLAKGEFNSLLTNLLSHPRLGHINRGDASAPPVADKAKACADYFAAWVRDYADLYGQKRAIHRGFEKTGPDVLRLLTQVVGVSPDAWLCGEGPDDLDFAERIRAALRKYHPQIADELADLMKKRVIDSVRYDQGEVKRRLAELLAAQRDFREMDVDGNGIQDYWTGDVSGLYRFQLEGEGLELIATSVAETDGAPLPAAGALGAPLPKPDRSQPRLEGKVSYFGYQSVLQDEEGRPLAQDTDGTGQAWRNREHFAVCAYPLGYGRVGRQTYLLTEKGTIWFKDTEGRPVTRLPKDTAAEGWEKAEEKEQYYSDHFDRLPLAFHLKRLQHADVQVRCRSLSALAMRCAPSQPTRPAREVDLGDGGYRPEPERRPLTPAALQILLTMLDDPNREVRQTTINALERIGHEAVPPAADHLKAWLESGSGKQEESAEADLIHDALEGLTRLIPDSPELPALFARTLKHPKAEVRRQAVGALGQLGPRASSQVPAVVEALSDADIEVVQRAVYSAEEIGPAARPAIPRLAELAVHGDMVAFRVMKKIGASPAQLSDAAEKIVRNKSIRNIDQEVIDEIENMGPAGIPLWSHLLREAYPEYVHSAMTQLAKLAPSHPEALSLLIEQLEHRWDFVRPKAAIALGNVGPAAASAVPALKKALGDTDAELRAAAAEALAKIEGGRKPDQP